MEKLSQEEQQDLETDYELLTLTDYKQLRTRLERAEGLLGRSAKVMREWTGYDVWRPLHDDISAFLAPTPPEPAAAPLKEPTKWIVCERCDGEGSTRAGYCIDCGGTGSRTPPPSSTLPT